MYRRNTGRLCCVFWLDMETKLIFNAYTYGPQGELLSAQEMLEFTLDPDLSQFALESIPKFNLTTEQFHLSEAELLAFAPWVNLTGLPLPEGFQIVGYSRAVPSDFLLEGDLLLWPIRMPITYLWIWAGDGLNDCILKIGFITGFDGKLPPESSLFIIDDSGSSTTLAVYGCSVIIEVDWVMPPWWTSTALPSHRRPLPARSSKRSCRGSIPEPKRRHHIGVSDGTEDGVIRNYHINILYVSNAAAVIIDGQPICVFSASDFFTPAQQLQMLLGLFWLFDINFLD